MAVSKISDATKTKLLNKSPSLLPNSPSKAGWSAQSIRNQLYQFALGNDPSLFTEINRIVDEMNEGVGATDWYIDKVSSVTENGTTILLGQSGFLYAVDSDYDDETYKVYEYRGNSTIARLPRFVLLDAGELTERICEVRAVSATANATANTTVRMLVLHDAVDTCRNIATNPNDTSNVIFSRLWTIVFFTECPNASQYPDAIAIYPATGAIVPESQYSAYNTYLTTQCGGTFITANLLTHETFVDAYADVLELTRKLFTDDIDSDYENANNYSVIGKLKSATANTGDTILTLLYGGTGYSYDNPLANSIVDKLKDAISDEANTRSGADNTLTNAISALNKGLYGNGGSADLVLGGHIYNITQNILQLYIKLFKGSGYTGTEANPESGTVYYRLNSAESNIGTNASAITTLRNTLLGYSRTYTCATFSDFNTALGGGSTLVNSDGDSVGLSILKTGDMVYITDTDAPDFWWEKNASADQAGAETYTVNNTTYYLYVAGVGYAHKVEIDDTVLQGYATTALNAKNDAVSAKTDAESARDTAVNARNEAVASVANTAYLTFEVDLTTGELYMVKVNRSDYTLSVDQTDGNLYLVTA